MEEKKAECEFVLEKSADWERCRGGTCTSGLSLPQVVKKVQGIGLVIKLHVISLFYSFVSLFCFLVNSWRVVGDVAGLAPHLRVNIIPLGCVISIWCKHKKILKHMLSTPIVRIICIHLCCIFKVKSINFAVVSTKHKIPPENHLVINYMSNRIIILLILLMPYIEYRAKYLFEPNGNINIEGGNLQ